ncbi:MAG: hypothetical protein E7417_00105 [Ruminococcaceae bacterium]|nr:hypothetical protein [Oscillospiraceae bacterium]
MNTIRIERNANGKVEAGIVTKAFLKRADVFGTDEYIAVQRFYEMHPNATIKTKSIRKNPDKETNKNLTYANMELFIKTIACDEKEMNKLLEEMSKIKNISQIQKRPYKYVLDWFKATFPEYTSHDIFKDNKDENIENKTNIVPLKTVNE